MTLRKFKARLGKRLKVLGQWILDNVEIELPDCPTVREHLKLGRLIECKQETAKEPEPKAEKSKKKDS